MKKAVEIAIGVILIVPFAIIGGLVRLGRAYQEWAERHDYEFISRLWR